MAINNSTTDHFEMLLEAAHIANTTGFTTLLVFESVASIASVFPNGLLLYVLIRTSIFPLNLRLLLGHLSLNLIWYAAAFGIKAASHLRILEEADDAESLIVNAYLCKLSELSNTIPLQNTIYTSLALCLERLYSTVWYKQYERQHSKPYLALILIPVVWAVTLANQLNSLFSIERAREMPICESLLSTTANSALLTLSISLSCESLCVLLTLIVFLWNNIKLKNMTLNRAQQTLGARFQISQNVQLNTMLMPSMVLQSLCYLPNYIFLFFVIFGMDEEKFHLAVRVILIHCNYLWKLIYALVHPLVAFASKAKLYQHLKKHSSLIRFFTRTMRRVRPVVTGEAANNKPEEAEAHFDVLNKIWAQKANQRKR